MINPRIIRAEDIDPLERDVTCCFTGHRDIPFSEYERVSKEIIQIVDELGARGINRFLAGGALGFDMIAAITVANMKQTEKDIVLSLALPYRGHDQRWRSADRKMLEKVIERADEVVYVSEEYFKGCMLARDRFMVDRSSVCVCYLTKPTGGTAYTVDYAIKRELDVINVAPDF